MRALTRVVGPAAAYFAAFCLYTWRWMAHPGSVFFTDTGDGYQNVWNMWWVHQALVVRQQLPWHTTLLHYPYGTSLLGQTMNPFNGLVGIVLTKFMPLVAAFNVMIVFSFVASGVTAFWLCAYFARSYVASIVAGFLVTFSSYHLAKTLGLMQLVSLEWVPLFILAWWQLLTRPRLRWAIGAPVCLLLVLLCDYYYFLFSVVAAAAIAVHLWRRSELRLGRRMGTVAGALSAALALPLPLALVWSNIKDPMKGGHPSHSTDVLSLFIDGGHWRFHSLTGWYYGTAVPGPTVAETSIYLTVTAVALLVAALVLRDRAGPHTRFWLWFAGVAAVLCLGPHLVVHRTDTGVPLPFDLARLAVPLLDYNVEPERLSVMTFLAAGVLVASVLSRLDLRRTRDRVILLAVAAGLLIELWPASPPSAPVSRPAYVAALKRLPPGAVIDDAAVRGGQVDPSLQLYDQVLDGKPLAFGYISRTPSSVAAADAGLESAIAGHRYADLCHHYGFRYFTTPAADPLPGQLPVLYDDGQAIIYGVC